MLYFGCRLYEPTHVTIAGGCVIDDARVHGHYGVFSTVTIKKCHLSGVLHPQCSVVGAMEAFATKEDARLMEHGPQHVIMDVGDDSTNVEALQLDDCSPAEHAV
uniref:Uncharacterized protein n=1 Tax=Craspedostauros australis TaxID=1486917 RepID=A0A7R9WRE9_9STRA